MSTKNTQKREDAVPASFLTTFEAARELSTDSNYIRRLLANGRLSGRKRADTGEWEVDARSVQRYHELQVLRDELRKKLIAEGEGEGGK